MLRRQLSHATSWRRGPVCLLCSAPPPLQSPHARSFAATSATLQRPSRKPKIRGGPSRLGKADKNDTQDGEQADSSQHTHDHDDGEHAAAKAGKRSRKSRPAEGGQATPKDSKVRKVLHKDGQISEGADGDDIGRKIRKVRNRDPETSEAPEPPMSLRDALLGAQPKKGGKLREPLEISIMFSEDLEFKPVDVEIPPVPMLSYGLDRVLFNPGVYRLQDPRSHIYNFDPYLEKIMPVSEFDFDALSEYKTSSKDEELLAITQKSGAKFTGSTSSMSGILQHFHYVLSNFRPLNHEMLSREFPEPSKRFSKITLGPSAVFLRHKDGVYAIDADKSYDTPNIMSWLGHSLEKLLTTERSEFERYRKSSPEKAPSEDDSSRCYHYSKQGNLLMRSQLDAYDPRLPGSGVFDLKTRAVVSIRMNHQQYEAGSGYQLRHALGEWESFEREFYDMTRATLLKYSLQVRMGRMDGIFLAYHNIERIFGFQYLSLSDMDAVLHGQRNTYLGDQEFKLSIGLVDELLTRATTKFPNTSLRIHVEARDGKQSFLYVFVEPVTEEQADKIQSMGDAEQKDFARRVVGVGKDNPEVQAAWQDLQDEVDQQVDEDRGTPMEEAQKEDIEPLQEDFTEELQHEDAEKPQDEVTEAIEKHSDNPSAQEVDPNAAETAAASETPKGPLMGWTLTVRSKVNEGYVDRPIKLEENDNWKIEYHLQEIPEDTRWKLYEAVKERRRSLVGQRDEEADKGLKHYRDLIQRYSNRGRKWRQEQDELNEEKGVRVYRPMGPGSEAEKSPTEDAKPESVE